MKIQEVPFTTTDWNTVHRDEHRGDSGTSFWRTFEAGNIRVRLVDYSPGFQSDHWCGRGHILFVLEGELVVRLKEGEEFSLTSGMGFQTEDDEMNPHLVLSRNGAKVFIVD